MRRMHVHVGVKDIESSVDFYTGLFGVEPTVCETDYAKWILENPRVNFAISTRCEVGVDHLGIQCENEKILAETAERLSQSGRPLIKQEAASCCYATGKKVWVSDPQGVAWETFMTTGDITSYGEDSVDMSQLKVMST